MSVPVLIVGAGPVGSVLALELAGRGVPSVLVERSTAPSRHPKMDFVNARSMELLARLGLAGEIRERGVPGHYDFTFLWYRDLTEAPVSSWSYPSPDAVRERAAAARDGSSPAEPYARITGSALEDLLRRRARATAAIDLREGWNCTDVAFDPGEPDSGAVVTLSDPAGRAHRIAARYVVGCDGANSLVRERAGIAVDTDGPVADHCDIYFTSSDPALRRHGRFFLVVLGTGLTLVSRDERDTWTAAFPLAPGRSAARDAASRGFAAPDPVAQLKRRLGVDIAIDEVRNVATWQGRLAVAEAYRRGPVFLAGDAAHQFYPTGGHGANTGLADAVDLGWKLAARLGGWGGEQLLDSYQAERRPVALFNREMCFNLLEVWRRFPALTAQGASREQLAGFLDQDSYQIDNIGIHCGYRYSGSPVVCHEDGGPPPWQWRRIVPTSWPGGRPPSALLPGGRPLFERFGPDFTLVDFTADESGAVLVKQAVAHGVPTSHLPVHDERIARAWERPLVLVRPDQHVAWRGEQAPADWAAVLRRVSGATG